MADIAGLYVGPGSEASGKFAGRDAVYASIYFRTDDEKPVVTLISPANGSKIGRADAITVRVTDEIDLARVIISVQQGASRELAHDETGFVGLYASSTRTAIAGGYEFALRRTGGWSYTATVHVSPNDFGGNLAD